MWFTISYHGPSKSNSALLGRVILKHAVREKHAVPDAVRIKIRITKISIM